MIGAEALSIETTLKLDEPFEFYPPGSHAFQIWYVKVTDCLVENRGDRYERGRGRAGRRVYVTGPNIRKDGSLGKAVGAASWSDRSDEGWYGPIPAKVAELVATVPTPKSSLKSDELPIMLAALDRREIVSGLWHVEGYSVRRDADKTWSVQRIGDLDVLRGGMDFEEALEMIARRVAV